jgi:hypothetical protein
MSTDIEPISGFRYRSDAERVQRALLSAGVDCTVREPEDSPRGWRVERGELRFAIWVARERREEANRIIRESWGPALGLTCSRCGAEGPTVHITS